MISEKQLTQYKPQLVMQHSSPKEATARAKEMIELERSGKQLGLYTQYPLLNRASGKYFRFNQVNLLAGLSGHGKSYFLNLITKAFINTAINNRCIYKPVVLQFCYEMSAHNEILRAVADDLNVNYSHLLSSNYDENTGEYNKISDAELARIEKALEYYDNIDIRFYDNPGNIAQMYDSIFDAYRYYYYKGKKEGIEYRIIVNVDHTLLVETMKDEKALELMANVGKLAIKVRKDFDGMVNLLGQLNNNIEDVKRLITPALHYPQKSDIYAQGQLYNACDNVYVIHQPALLKLTKYGTNSIDTANLIHLIKLKSRHGQVGNLWFKNELNEGKISEIDTTIRPHQKIEINNSDLDFGDDGIVDL